MDFKKIIIHACWEDSDDEELVDYAQSQPHEVIRLTGEEILTQNPTDIDALFCNTDIFQQLVPAYQPPETYPSQFDHLYRRQITVVTLSEVLARPFPFFIKPLANDKAFTGRVIRDETDLEVVKTSQLHSFYVVEVVNYVAEFRLFIAERKLRGCVEATSYVLGYEATDLRPPVEFLNKVLEANPYSYVVIDVGLTTEEIWNVVEVNPPFALSSYNWPIQEYYTYCRDAWQDITMKILSNKTVLSGSDNP
jgi:hypothetical protein